MEEVPRQFVPSYDVEHHVLTKIEHIEGLQPPTHDSPASTLPDVYITCELRAPIGTVLGVARRTTNITATLHPLWNEVLDFGVPMQDVPQGTMLHVTAHAIVGPLRTEVLGSASCNLFGKNSTFKRVGASYC